MISFFTQVSRAALCAVLGLLAAASMAHAGIYNLSIGEKTVNLTGSDRTGIAINGTIPGPVLRFKEGEDITINVTNTMAVDTSIHWHGLILPFKQDGVPGISFDGIKPGTTHTYRFPAQNNGTYWYHSHSGLQEQAGVYGAIVIEPKAREPFRYDREYVVVLSDWHDTKPERVLGNLKKMSDYYNYNQRTIGDFFSDVSKKGFGAAIEDRKMWGDMRMTPTDIADVSGYTFLVNGKNTKQNWTGLFKPGERVRLRFVNASAMTFFDVRIPGLKMTVVQADGNNVWPVNVDEFRIAVAETYDVIVRPEDDKAYTLFAESMGRTGFARGTLAPKEGMAADIPAMRERPLLSMTDMSMDHGSMAGMDHSTMKGMDHSKMTGMDHSKMGGPKPDPFYAPGSGLMPKAANGGKFLSYADLKAQKPLYKVRKPTREITLRLTGNMERYFWSINDKKYSQADPIRLKYGERVRFKFVNETMMTHPMHLHGMWTILDNGSKKWNPIKHTVSIAPGTTVYTETEVDAPGKWAFHCHLIYHMATGMFREIIVEGGPDGPQAKVGG
ncbi:MAG: copper resistance system multicopper oxidase [Proteobacteria bacterium]|nr:copper resistance system multicopper oxidase [Pseudomonadota bacterium]MDA1323334.1 copper resistance system multicopper oxidase [Pseudomonadota bacterium]